MEQRALGSGLRPLYARLAAYRVYGQRLPGASASDHRPLAGALVPHRVPRPYLRPDSRLAVYDHGINPVVTVPGGTLHSHRDLVPHLPASFRPRMHLAEFSSNGDIWLSNFALCRVDRCFSVFGFPSVGGGNRDSVR